MFAILGVLSLLVAVVVWFAGARIVVFASGSMAPAIPAGAIALTVPAPTDELQTGDIITVQRPGDGHLVTHRIVRIEFSGATFATLRGDANSVEDATPYPLGSTTQRVVWAVPEVGKVVARIQSPWLLAAVAALLVVLALPTRASSSAPPFGTSSGKNTDRPKPR
ncbi:signal peptidase I [Agromyces sp. S2-1-8]|uniref:signal peptidase I n=1 Tax=Agromyces sp. S2-1-8 TaxID=2897180 RepID=UPI001E3EF4D4|nr:signal peptidase I [Agromyces sp. S2-1-8]MCD5348389.1 signal peptidase I [Agromyces sp. S2-1-8]